MHQEVTEAPALWDSRSDQQRPTVEGTGVLGGAVGDAEREGLPRLVGAWWIW